MTVVWRRALLQSALMGLCVAALEFPSSAVANFADHAALRFTVWMILDWTTLALPLAVSAQWVEGRWSARAIVALFAVEALVLAALYLRIASLLELSAALVGARGHLIPGFTSILWMMLVYGGAFFVYCLLTQRSLRVHGLLARAELERGRSAAQIDTARAEVLEGRIDPALLLRTLAALRRAYATNRQRAEDMLDALVAFLRLAMPALRSGKSTLQGELSLLRAYAQLLARVDEEPAPCRVEAGPLAADPPFPPLLLIPLLEQARALQPAGAPPPRVALSHDSQGLVLTIEASTSAGWLDDALAQRLDRALRVLYSARARWKSGPAPSLSVWLPLSPDSQVEDCHERASPEFTFAARS